MPATIINHSGNPAIVVVSMSLKSTANGDGFGAPGVETGSAVTVGAGSTGCDSGTGVTSRIEVVGEPVSLSAADEEWVSVEPPPGPLDPELPAAGGVAIAVSDGCGFLGAGFSASGFSTTGFSTAGALTPSANATRFAGLGVFFAAGAETGVTSSSGTIGPRTTSLPCGGGGAASLSGVVAVVPVDPHAASPTTVTNNATNLADMMPLARKGNLCPKVLLLPSVAGPRH